MAKYRQGIESEDARNVQRQAFAGLLWSKQFYYFNVHQWLKGDPAQPAPPAERKKGRNHEWKHLNNADIISHARQMGISLVCCLGSLFSCSCFYADRSGLCQRISYCFLHKNGICIPTVSCLHMNGHFGDVNPPVHAWAAWRVYRGEQRFHKVNGRQGVFWKPFFINYYSILPGG